MSLGELFPKALGSRWQKLACQKLCRSDGSAVLGVDGIVWPPELQVTTSDSYFYRIA